LPVRGLWRHHARHHGLLPRSRSRCLSLRHPRLPEQGGRPLEDPLLRGTSTLGRTPSAKAREVLGLIIVTALVAFLLGIIVGAELERRPSKPALTLSPVIWDELPSGWTRTHGSLTIYAMTQDDGAYWWVSRNGKTIIEGPSRTLEAAQRAAEQEARDLSV